MRESFDPEKVIIPEVEMHQSQRFLEMYYRPPSQMLLSRDETREISPQVLQDLKNELIKLRTILSASQNAFKTQIRTLNLAIDQFQTQRFLNPRMMQQPFGPRPDQIKAKTPQSQKTAGKNRNLTQNQAPQNPRGSERSVRSNDRVAQQSSGNPLDIWCRSEPMFAPLPSTEDITNIFRSVIESGLKNSRMKMIPPPPESTQHWSITLMEKMQKMAKENKRVPKLQQPPGPPPSAYDISEYWMEHTPSFPIEPMQKQNASTLHHLLSCIVETEPLPPSNRQKDLYLPLNVLAPRYKHDKYLCLDFEQRLNLELKSVGLDASTAKIITEKDTFSDEIAKKREEINQLIPIVQKSAKQLLEKMPALRKIENQRYEEQRAYNQLLQQTQTKKKKK